MSEKGVHHSVEVTEDIVADFAADETLVGIDVQQFRRRNQSLYGMIDTYWCWAWLGNFRGASGIGFLTLNPTPTSCLFSKKRRCDKHRRFCFSNDSLALQLQPRDAGIVHFVEAVLGAVICFTPDRLTLQLGLPNRL